ncbi:putative bifunctional diguanylate cyclase/phosphodiesterase [Sphingomonas sp.]|uniref:putative bifunctional diguanylate cyclase/phosphodiesterase n=1 Tax=Sphingomonas sp. TaxID=28214 RepID=UPI003B005422
MPIRDVSDVARLQHLAGRYRPPAAVVLAVLSVSKIGVRLAALWFGAVLICEAWTWFSTKPAMARDLTGREMTWYVLSGTVTMPAWAALGTMFWFTPAAEDKVVAVALWVGQLLYTQRFVFQSYVAVLLGNSVMVATMVAMPIVHPVLSGTDQALFEIGLLFCIGFAISSSLAAYARIRSLADQNAAIARTAITDELTGLPNRVRFARSLEAVFRNGSPAFVLYMDLDRFKQVNDTLGHQAGDALLRQFAGRLLEVSPPGAVVARLGGDEFAALIEAGDLGTSAAETLCRRVINAVKPPFAIANGQAHVGVSIGVASTGDGDGESDDLMRRADIALYTMKANGRGGYRVFSAELETEVRSRAEIEQALRDAVVTFGDFSLAYQPKMDRSGKATGVEALLRWRIGERAVPPDIFVPIAEETGLILPLGDWVMAEALAFARRWPELSVAVNLSPAQLRDPDFAPRLLTLMADGDVDPARLELEVTETALFESTGQAIVPLDQLRSAGLHLALDDFGTGYSSLRHLHSVAVDRVKIDKSFVAGLGRGVESAAIITAVIQLGHSMGIRITAEGVETPEQRDFLIEAGADELQGYFFSRPLSEADLSSWISRGAALLAA